MYSLCNRLSDIHSGRGIGIDGLDVVQANYAVQHQRGAWAVEAGQWQQFGPRGEEGRSQQQRGRHPSNEADLSGSSPCQVLHHRCNRAQERPRHGLGYPQMAPPLNTNTRRDFQVCESIHMNWFLLFGLKGDKTDSASIGLRHKYDWPINYGRNLTFPQFHVKISMSKYWVSTHSNQKRLSLCRSEFLKAYSAMAEN